MLREREQEGSNQEVAKIDHSEDPETITNTSSVKPAMPP